MAAMKPFLLLGTRVDDEAADDEYAAFLRCTGLTESSLRRVRVEAHPVGPLVLDDWSGIILGGGPFNVSDPPELKSAVQQRVEADLRQVTEQVLTSDFPFMGACYGIGTLGILRGGIVDRTHGEPVGGVCITLTDDGASDPIFGTLPREFAAYLGHKEAVTRLPAGTVVLASGDACPVQAFRMGRNVYATQFHPELDVAGLRTRVEVYRHHGYFAPDEADDILAMAAQVVVEHPPQILAAFVAAYARG